MTFLPGIREGPGILLPAVGAAGLVALFILRDIDRDLSPAEQANLAKAIRADVVDVLASGA